MRKRFCFLFIICIFIFTMIGCGNEIPEMSEEESAMVSNYAATLLLKYDANYQTKLLNQEQLEKEEQMQKQIQEESDRLAALEAEKEAKKQEEQQAKESEGQSSVETVTYVDPAEFLGLDGISISYNGVEYLDQYPKDGEDLYFATTATEGCKLAVVHLGLSNQTAEVRTVDVFSTNARFKVSFNDGDYHSIMSTLFTEDFSVFNGELQPGECIDTVLLMELKEEDCVDVNGLNLYIKCNDQTLKTKLYP